VSHFTDYGPILPGVPDAPTNLAASASDSGINLSWIASPTATTYTIYRSLTNSNFTTAIVTGVTSTTYLNTGLVSNTIYYYKVAGVNGNGEGPNSSSANDITHSSGGGQSGGSGGVTTTTSTTTSATPAVAVTPASTTTPAVTATPETPEARQVLIAQLLAQIEALRTELQALVASTALTNANTRSAFNRTLTLKSMGDDVVRLQTFLEERGLLVIPKSVAKGYFGGLTKKALAIYQQSIGLPSVGVFGPLTRSHLNSLSQ